MNSRWCIAAYHNILVMGRFSQHVRGGKLVSPPEFNSKDQWTTGKSVTRALARHLLMTQNDKGDEKRGECLCQFIFSIELSNKRAHLGGIQPLILIESPLKCVSSSHCFWWGGAFLFRTKGFRIMSGQAIQFPVFLFTFPRFLSLKLTHNFHVVAVPLSSIITWVASIMSWKASLSRHLPVVRFFGCPKSPASRGVM